MSLKWYALHSKPNREEFLVEQLKSRDIEVYYPFLRVRPVNPRAKTRKPFFPGYLFIRADLQKGNSLSFDHVPGAANLVCFGGEAAHVPENIIQAIRTKVEILNSSPEVDSAVQPGDIVTVQNGPFEGYEAVVDTRLSGADRVRILLNLLQAKNLTVELPLSQVKLKEVRKDQKI